MIPHESCVEKGTKFVDVDTRLSQGSCGLPNYSLISQELPLKSGISVSSVHFLPRLLSTLFPTQKILVVSRGSTLYDSRQLQLVASISFVLVLSPHDTCPL